jgi:asparagine synthase (glutamine-hydrolysing)
MCGICGYVSFRPAAPLGAAASACVEAMLGALAHRGPDASALHASEAAVLGATRLSIRGVHDGRQPLVDAGGTVVAVCNGEIDNHREIRRWLAERGRPVRQATDVAVIPELYLELGDAFAERLVGAFAIGLWDARRQRLLLVRDRAGEKPLFFCAGADRALFASEPAALALGAPLPTPRAATAAPAPALSAGAAGPGCGGPPAADSEALAHYLRFGCFPVPRTPFAGVQKVGPASAWRSMPAACCATATGAGARVPLPPAGSRRSPGGAPQRAPRAPRELRRAPPNPPRQRPPRLLRPLRSSRAARPVSRPRVP